MPPSHRSTTECAREDEAASGRPVRPRARRYPFAASIELTDVESETRFHEQTRDLSLYGCHVLSGRAFLLGTKMRIRIVHAGASFHALGKVVYAAEKLGLGIIFTDIEEKDQETLEEWIFALRGKPARVAPYLSEV
jgi:c-di-GMP-binding flagellar brake protein YcgR